jgi:hypothetical protein
MRFGRTSKGEEVRKTEWHRIVYMYGTFISITFSNEC